MVMIDIEFKHPMPNDCDLGKMYIWCVNAFGENSQRPQMDDVTKDNKWGIFFLGMRTIFRFYEINDAMLFRLTWDVP
jgi:hypothetical protein